MKKLYIEVTLDEYQLPIHITDSLKEMCLVTGENKYVIASSINRWKNGKTRRPRFVTVEVDGDDE